NLTDVRSVRFSFDQRTQGAFLMADLAFADPAALYSGPEGPRVIASTAAGLIPGPVSSVQVTFSTAMDPATFTPQQDVVINGPGGIAIPATNVAPVAGSGGRQFTIAFAPQSVAGDYTL